MALPKPAGIKINGNSLTDHGRGPIDIVYTPIEYSQRMWNGRRRKRHIATKVSIRTSWDNLPNTNSDTADEHLGYDAMKSLYDANKGDLTVVVTFADGTEATYTMMFIEFSGQLMKRGVFDLYSASMALEEV